jgi:hypothetical protein
MRNIRLCLLEPTFELLHQFDVFLGETVERKLLMGRDETSNGCQLIHNAVCESNYDSRSLPFSQELRILYRVPFILL